MAILVNKGQRSFVLKEGVLVPGQQMTVDNETAEKLSRTYPKEIMLIMPEVVKVPVAPIATVKAEPKVEEPVYEPLKFELPDFLKKVAGFASRREEKRGRKAKAK